MNAYEVLFEHHKVLRGLCKKITAIPPDTDERQVRLGDLWASVPAVIVFLRHYG